MLRQLKTSIVKAKTVLSVITWSNFNKATLKRLEARSLSLRKHLFFGMTSMKM